MKSGLWEAAVLLLLLLLIVSLVVVAVIGSNDVSQKGTEIPLGQCYSAENGYTFCNNLWLKNISYVTVSKEGEGEDLLIIFMFQTVESRGYLITSAGFSVYIEPAR